MLGKLQEELAHNLLGGALHQPLADVGNHTAHLCIPGISDDGAARSILRKGQRSFSPDKAACSLPFHPHPVMLGSDGV